MQCIESTKSYYNNTSSALLASILATSTNNNSFNSEEASNSHTFSQESGEITECVWRRSELSALEFVIYAFVVPSLAFFGLCANFINAIVFMRPKMTPSAFSYLAALSWLDCISCMLITLTAFSRSFLYSSTFWMAYDFQWQTPLFGITTGAANLILACVSLDRFIYLRWGIPNGTPKFCRRFVARRMIFAVILLAIIVNVPYFCVFVVNDDGTFETTAFYFSKYYMIHNWFTFILLTLLPAIFLMVGNTAILIAFCQWTKQSKKCQSNYASASNKNAQNRYKHQMKLTVTIIIVITLYLVGELPAHLTSRKSAVNLLYGGDVSKVDFKTMQRLEVICITLNAIQLSMNIIVYAVINPSFVPEFFNCLKAASDVCFRFMGCLALASCWHKTCSSRKKKHKNSECANNEGPNNVSTDFNGHSLSDIHCYEENENGPDESTLDVTSQGKSARQELEISVISLENVKQSFDNPSFNLEIVE
ncbi:putative G-protein coupled receptor B0563.6 [Lucilia cuprina]|nr:putative G-protein coupled receptor B0563.6 [Lucilia cuprina]